MHLFRKKSCWFFYTDKLNMSFKLTSALIIWNLTFRWNLSLNCANFLCQTWCLYTYKSLSELNRPNIFLACSVFCVKDFALSQCHLEVFEHLCKCFKKMLWVILTHGGNFIISQKKPPLLYNMALNYCQKILSEVLCDKWLHWL